MLKIGFANKFYTLWDITEETRYLGEGHHEDITHYSYIKNISYDKETALAKYPEAEIDEDLRGKTHSWNSAPKEVWENVNIFRFGKYKYEPIENGDTHYLEWYWNQVGGEHQEYVGKVLESRGYEVRTREYISSYDGSLRKTTFLIDPETLEWERKDKEELNKVLKKCENNEILTIVPDRNVDEDGKYKDILVIYKFPNVKENYYQGHSYYLPIDAKGKSKRIKNKTVNITDYTFDKNDNRLIITVNDFNVAK